MTTLTNNAFEADLLALCKVQGLKVLDLTPDELGYLQLCIEQAGISTQKDGVDMEQMALIYTVSALVDALPVLLRKSRPGVLAPDFRPSYLIEKIEGGLFVSGICRTNDDRYLLVAQREIMGLVTVLMIWGKIAARDENIRQRLPANWMSEKDLEVGVAAERDRLWDLQCSLDRKLGI